MTRQRWVVLISLGCVVVLLLGNEGFRHTVRAYEEEAKLQRALTALRAEHDRLARELNLIQHDPSYVEYLIRKHLGYVKKGEVEYRLITPNESQDR